jgi:amino acid adenylation domain-containing protein
VLAIADFLEDLRLAGVQLWLSEGKLRYRPAGALDGERLAVLRERQAEVIAAMLAGPDAGPPAGPRPDVIPLSDHQQGMWFLNQMGALGPAYNQTDLFRITGELDVQALRSAIAEITRRHEVLRTAFPARNGVGVQVVEPAGDPHFTFLDVSHLSAEDQNRWLDERRRMYAKHRFDIAVADNFWTELVRLGPIEHVLALLSYHLVIDGASYLTIFNAELRTLYTAYRTGRSSPLPELRMQYADYALWQQGRGGAEAKRHLDYWTERLTGAPHTLDLPTDRPRPAVADIAGDEIVLPVPAEVADGLRRLAGQEGATLFTVLLAAFHALLGRWSGQTDVSVGLMADGRAHPDVAATIGHFVNPVVLRADLAGRPTFAELLGQVRYRLVEALEHRHVPFDRLVAELRPQRDPAVQPLFQVMFIHLGAAKADLLDEVTVTKIEPDNCVAMFDLTLYARETMAGDLQVGLGYRTALFDRATMRRLAGYLVTLLSGVAASPDVPVDDLPLMSAEQRHEVLERWNDTARPFDEGLCLHQLVERQAAATPAATAVVFEGRELTYRELDGRANALARRLRELGVGPDERVGVAVPRSLALVVANLAVLKAGGACVPIDPAYPLARRRLIAEDAAVRLVLRAGTGPASDAAPDAAPVLDLDAFGTPVAATGPTGSADPATIAWVLYTSGSTGRPKGVAMSHRALHNQVQWQRRQGPGGGGRTLQWAALGFDIFFQEMLTTLSGGDPLVLVGEEVRHDFERLLDVIEEHRIERVFMPFVALRGLAELAVRLDRTPRSLRAVLTAGEQLQATPAIRAFFERLPGCTLYNQYGPIEVHLATSHQLDHDPASWPALPPIGRPFDNVRTYVLDADLRPVAPGVAGELFVGGSALARGYLGRPELTAEKFLPDPFADGARMYRTGDRVRWNATGRLEFIGRFDDQVKIRGFRVEVAEVEAVLTDHPGVRECAVAAHGYGVGDRRLVAYVVPDPDRAPSAVELRDFLAARLPDYMVPAAYQTVGELPRTPSGKLSRRLLPRPDEETDWAGSAEYAPPATPLEGHIAAVWADELGLPRVGRSDNFFELGGHSLLAVTVVNRLGEITGRTVRLRTLFEAPTVAGLAARMGDAGPR